MELSQFFNSFGGLVVAILSLFLGTSQLIRNMPYVFRRRINQRIALRIMIAASLVLFAAIILAVRNPDGLQQL